MLGVNAIVVENRSDHAVPLTVRELAGGIMIDRKILEGTLAVPIGPAGRGAERGMSLDVGANAFLDAPLQVLTGPNVVANTGGVVRVGSGPFFLAVGKGTVIVRSREGADILEVEDPRSVTLLPVERDMPACTRAALGGLLADPPSPIRGGDSMTVTSVTRDAEGCRMLGLKRFGFEVDYRLCVPDATFPFADTDSLTAFSFALDGMRISNGAGTALDLLPVRFQTRATVDVADLAIAFAEDASCASVEPSCGDVEVPTKVRLSFDGKTVETLAVGESVVDPGNPGRTLFLVGARFRPAFAPACSARGEPPPPAEMFVALVEKP